ncbi:MAG: hypothetical protein M3069_22625, partial [Chloroflexota bacterium]|nr:hypothetical protein [Chloroflexota bacterium]
MTAGTEHTRGEMLGRRIIQLVALLWLGMLITPVEELFRNPGVMAMAGLAGVAMFLGTYLWAWFRRFAQPDETRDVLRQWAPFGVLLLLSTALNVGFGPDWYPFFIFAAVGAAVTVPTAPAAWSVVGTTVLAGLIGLAQRASLQ